MVFELTFYLLCQNRVTKFIAHLIIKLYGLDIEALAVIKAIWELHHGTVVGNLV